MLAQERDEFRALSILVINAMASRFWALRAFAARLGYALRHADLAGSDLIRFSEPIAQVLADLGDELKHLMHTAALATDSSLQLLNPKKMIYVLKIRGVIITVAFRLVSMMSQSPS